MKKQLKLLAYLFLILIFTNTYLGILIQVQYFNPSGSLVEPLITPFYWPRLIILLIPSIVLIVFTSTIQRWGDVGLILWIGAAIAHFLNNVMSVVHPYQYMHLENTTTFFSSLCVITNSAQFIVLVLLISLGFVYIYKINFNNIVTQSKT